MSIVYILSPENICFLRRSLASLFSNNLIEQIRLRNASNFPFFSSEFARFFLSFHYFFFHFLHEFPASIFFFGWGGGGAQCGGTVPLPPVSYDCVSVKETKPFMIM